MRVIVSFWALLFSSINLSIFTTPSHRSHSHSLIIISLQQYSLGTCTVLDSRVKSVSQATWSLSFWHLQLVEGWKEVPRQWQHRVVPLLGDAQAAKGPLTWTWEWGTVSGGCDVVGLRRKHVEKMWKWKRKGSPGWAREHATRMEVQNGRGARQELRLAAEGCCAHTSPWKWVCASPVGKVSPWRVEPWSKSLDMHFRKATLAVRGWETM